ncbi:hypothetical protein F5890DRAFT_670432 [Lentinula detonsa]|uniref:Uncharacterized protein n=1 Tax=Lentinula detonsa TaxID=2804962 RepID=A0AA38PS03_9AGAR|nr:hypothetical protein F5890DRAFT_670432 [Lentinula detonsa]
MDLIDVRASRDSQIALLLVYTDKGAEILETEFNEWYDEEHIPRLLLFPGCTRASRYRAIDSKPPPWTALYHLDSPEIPESREWSQLNEQASDNEKTILGSIPIVTRSIYTMFHCSHAKDIPHHSAGKVACIVHLQIKSRVFDVLLDSSREQADLEAKFKLWHQNFITRGVSTTPGWVRSTMYTRYSGSDMKTTPELKIAMDCHLLVIHEWDENGDAMEISKLEANVAAQVQIWEKENLCDVTRETRIFSLHKEW